MEMVTLVVEALWLMFRDFGVAVVVLTFVAVVPVVYCAFWVMRCDHYLPFSASQRSPLASPACKMLGAPGHSLATNPNTTRTNVPEMRPAP